MDKNVIVFPVRSYDPALCDEAVEALFQSLPCTRAIGSDTKILLKPNLLTKSTPELSVTTHPVVVRAVIHACLRRGAQAENIVVADSSGGVYNPSQMKSVYRASGLWEVCEEEGVCAYTECRTVSVPSVSGKLVSEFELLRPVAEADFIIDLPKLKTHVMTGLTAATKNLFGTIPGLKKAQFHTRFPDKERFGDMLVDLLQTVKPDMAILDGITGMEGDGPHGGSPRPLGLLLASEDLLNLDLAAADLIGIDPASVPYLNAARKRNLCASRFDPADLGGQPESFSSLLPTGWKLPSGYADGKTGSTDFADKVPSVLQPLAKTAETFLAPRPVVNPSLCIGCGKCAEICPRHTIEMKNKKSVIHPQNCIHCFCCHEMCPVKAVAVKQRRIFKL